MAIHMMRRAPTLIAVPAFLSLGVLTPLTAVPSAAVALEGPAPECVEYFQSWRYTDVHNGCDDAVSVTVEYTNNQWAPCRVIEPGGRATFAGYGTNENYVTGLRTCDPASPTTGA